MTWSWSLFRVSVSLGHPLIISYTGNMEDFKAVLAWAPPVLHMEPQILIVQPGRKEEQGDDDGRVQQTTWTGRW